jgi:divalent metal cation (Fe/Co/Zn/Cd) transporter
MRAETNTRKNIEKITWIGLVAVTAELTDKGMSPKDRIEIQALIQRIPHVQGTHRIRSRKIGGSFYMDLHLEVEGQMSVRQGHEISKTVRQTLMARYPKVIDVMVHLEPADENPGIKPG